MTVITNIINHFVKGLTETMKVLARGASKVRQNFDFDVLTPNGFAKAQTVNNRLRSRSLTVERKVINPGS
jgi:hypothetical protein